MSKLRHFFKKNIFRQKGLPLIRHFKKIFHKNRNFGFNPKIQNMDIRLFHAAQLSEIQVKGLFKEELEPIFHENMFF